MFNKFRYIRNAKKGKQLLKRAIIGIVKDNPGITNVEIAKKLDLQSDFEGSQKNYLSWSILGLLVNSGKISYKQDNKRRRYYYK